MPPLIKPVLPLATVPFPLTLIPFESTVTFVPAFALNEVPLKLIPFPAEYVVPVLLIVITPSASDVTVVAPVPFIVTESRTVVSSATVYFVLPFVVAAFAAVPLPAYK